MWHNQEFLDTRWAVLFQPRRPLPSPPQRLSMVKKSDNDGTLQFVPSLKRFNFYAEKLEDLKLFTPPSSRNWFEQNQDPGIQKLGVYM